MRVITVVMTLILSCLLFASCEKAKEPERTQPRVLAPAQPQPQKELSKPQRTEPEAQKAIKGSAPSTDRTPTPAPADKPVSRYAEPEEGDPKEIAEIMYKQMKRNIAQGPYPDDEGGCVYDLCAGVKDLWTAGNKKEYYTLILEVLKNDKIPSVRACAANYLNRKAAGRRGRDEVQESMKDEIVTALKKALADPNGEVKMMATGSLMSWEEYDVALPALEERVKEGESNAFRHLSCEERVLAYYDRKAERSEGIKGILNRALTSQFSEIRILAARHLFDCGDLEESKAEQIALGILEGLKDRTIFDYGFKEYPVLPPGYGVENKSDLLYSDSRACDFSIQALRKWKSKDALPVLKHIRKKHNDKIQPVCKREFNEAIEIIEREVADK